MTSKPVASAKPSGWIVTGMEFDRMFERALTDLSTDRSTLSGLATASLQEIRVTSASAIKVDTVSAVFHALLPDNAITVTGVNVPSGVDEQPLGQITIDGALNRLAAARHEFPERHDTTAWVSIENGLFRIADSAARTASQNENEVITFSEDADSAVRFDPAAEYEDRAVVALRLPGFPTIVQVSSESEAVRFPLAAVRAAYDDDGGFARHTAGSKLAEMGLVTDKQNPHVELTADRPGGPLSRQDQMVRAIVRAMLHLHNLDR